MTRLLLDTHLVLWWLSGDPWLPDQAMERVQDPVAEVYVSQVFLWEMANDGEQRDPFDRLMVCQSRVEPMLPLSVDSQLWRYGATVIVMS